MSPNARIGSLISLNRFVSLLRAPPRGSVHVRFGQDSGPSGNLTPLSCFFTRSLGLSMRSASVSGFAELESPRAPAHPVADAPARIDAAPSTGKSQKQIDLEEIYEEAIALAASLQKLPPELQSLVVDQCRAESPQEANLLLKLLNPSYLRIMKDVLSALKSAELSELFKKVTTEPSFDATSSMKEGKALVGELKNFIVANFPSGTNDSRNEVPRQLIVKMMKWFMTLEQKFPTSK